MSCTGCIYAAKTAGCDFSYPCNNTGIPIAKAKSESKKRSKEDKKEDKG